MQATKRATCQWTTPVTCWKTLWTILETRARENTCPARRCNDRKHWTWQSELFHTSPLQAEWQQYNFYIQHNRYEFTLNFAVGASYSLLWMRRWRWREKGVRNSALHSSHWKGLSSECVCRESRAGSPCLYWRWDLLPQCGHSKGIINRSRIKLWSQLGMLTWRQAAWGDLSSKCFCFPDLEYPYSPIYLNDTSIPKVNIGKLGGGFERGPHR